MAVIFGKSIRNPEELVAGDFLFRDWQGNYRGRKLGFDLYIDSSKIQGAETSFVIRIYVGDILIHEQTCSLLSGYGPYVFRDIGVYDDTQRPNSIARQMKVYIDTPRFQNQYFDVMYLYEQTSPFMCSLHKASFNGMNVISNPQKLNYIIGEQLRFNGLSVGTSRTTYYSQETIFVSKYDFDQEPEEFILLSGSTSTIGNNEITMFMAGDDPARDAFSFHITVEDRHVLRGSYTLNTLEPIIVGNNGISTSSLINYSMDVVGQTTGEVIASDVTCDISPTSITFDQAKENNNVVITLSYETLTQTPTYPITVFIEYRHPISLLLDIDDVGVYYYGRTNYFKLPTITSASLLFNDGTTETLSSSDIANFSFHLTEDDLTQLSAGSILPEGTTYIYPYLSYYDGKETRILKGRYELEYTLDSILSVELNNNPTLVLGNRLSSLKNLFNVKVTYNSYTDAEETTHYSEEHYSNFSFVNNDIILSSPTSDIEININGTTYGLDIDNFTFVNPTFKEVTVANVGSITLNNLVDSIDLRNAIATISYSDAEYTKSFEIGDSINRTSTTFGVRGYFSDNSPLYETSDETIDNYNGTNTLNVTLTEGYADGYLKFSVTNPFDNSEKTANVPITMLSLVEIKGIKVITPIYSDYKVGDTFLNENDYTEATIYWEQTVNGRNITQFKNIKLNTDYKGLNINPSIGTLFSNVDASKVVRVSSATNVSVNAEYSISVNPRSVSTSTKDIVLAGIFKQSIDLPNGKLANGDGNGVIALYEKSKTTVVNGERILVDENAKMYGYIDGIFEEEITSKVVLFDDYIPPIEGSSNIEVVFPSYTEGEADKINKCKFGCLFGSNNAVNRLFVSGNEDIGNADWHTAELNTTDFEGELENTNGDFSYIPSESVMFYGETDNNIVGYDIVSNDKLLVLKSKSDKEKTVYFRTPTSLKSINASGVEMTDLQGNVLYQEEFALVKGNNSVAGVSPRTITSLNGDTLFLSSDNQIVGLDLVGIIGDNQRYANSRSSYIDKELKELDMKDSILWTNNKYLFLSIKDKGLYVTHYLTKSNEQYEWFFLTSKSPTTFIEIDDEIYFGNDDGSFFKMFNGTWSDVTKLFAEQTLLVGIKNSQEEEKVYVSQNIIEGFEEGVDYKFQVIPEDDYNKNIYYQIAKVRTTADGNTDLLIDSDNNVLKLVAYKNSLRNREREAELIKTLGDKNIFYLNYLEEDVSELGTRAMDCVRGSEFDGFGYQVKLEGEQQEGYTVYKLFKKVNNNWVRMNVSNLYNAGICKMMSENLDIFNINREEFTFQLKDNGKQVDIVNYGGQDISRRFARAEIKHYQDVEAYFITAPMLATSLNSFKTIWQVTITNDTDIPSALEVSVASNKIPYSKTKTFATADQLGIDFNELAFYKVDLDKVVVPRTYTVSRILPMQKFLCFGFRNKKGNNAVLSEMAITYTVPYSSYGSD